ncbi:DUF3426 domain-containing protein [Clostridium sp. B9]|uniref:DUF3426 domain-containing protein n=1 Tax=Clostridium sp. B9 TaxID=3423224 RepID=UPI003D2EFEC8
MKKLRVGIILVIAIFTSVLFAGCSSSNDDKVYNMNQEINVGDLTLKVTGTERLESIDNLKAEQGKELLVVKYIMKNNTNDDKACSRIEFTLEDKNDKEIKSVFIPEDLKKATELKIANDKAVPANGELEGSVVFQVNKGAKDLVLDYEPEILDIDSVHVKLG